MSQISSFHNIHMCNVKESGPFQISESQWHPSHQKNLSKTKI